MVEAWPILEPATVYQHNWHIDVVARHLEAISRGELQDLLVNIPPGFMKSLMVSVFWPAWEWTWLPWTRWLFTSYDQALAVRDALKTRRLIESEWYQRRWSKVFRLTTDQNTKTRYDNSRTGWRLASGIAGLATGEHAHRRVCLKYNTPIVTDAGELPIGQVVERRLPVRVLAFDHATGRRRWRRITAYESSPGRACVRVRLSTGAVLEGTDDHPIYVPGRGYVGLATLLPGQALVADHPALRDLRYASSAHARTHGTVDRSVLRSCMPASSIARSSSETITEGRMYLRTVRQGVRGATLSVASGTSSILLEGLQGCVPIRSDNANGRPLRRMRSGDTDSTGLDWPSELLLAEVREPGTPSSSSRTSQRAVCEWRTSDAVSAGIFQNGQASDQGTRRLGVCCLPAGAKVFAGPPHRLRQDQPRSFEPGDAVCRVSSDGSYEDRDQRNVDGSVWVVAVERCATPDAVYNVRVESDHNYFAASVLVHNCDDPHKVKEAESDLERENVLTTWKETMTSRGIPTSPLNARVMVMQRVHELDVAADWLEREPHVHHICLPNEYESQPVPENVPAASGLATGARVSAAQCSIAEHDRRTQEGELLWPAMVDQAEANLLKTTKLGPYAYAGQFQQRPTPRVGMVIDPGWIQQTPDTLALSTCDLVMAWDLNYSSRDASDWTVGMVAAVDRDPELPHIHILDVFREHLASKQHDQEIANWVTLWKPILVGIERRAWEQQGATEDLIRLVMIRLERAHIGTTVEPVEADADKLSRAMIIPGRAKGGLITANKRAPWWSDLSRELSGFPKSQHDDQVDCLAHLVRLVVEKLSMVRAQRALLGHSSRMQYVNGTPPLTVDPKWGALVGSAR